MRWLPLIVLYFNINTLALANGSSHCETLFLGPSYGNLSSSIFARSSLRAETIELDTTSAVADSSVDTNSSDSDRRVTNSAIAEKIRAIEPALSAKSALYFAAGVDSSTLFTLFKDLQNVVAVDQHPFFTEVGTTLKLVQAPTDFRGVTSWDEVDGVGSIASSVVSRLHSDIEGFRLRRITAFNEPIQDVKYAPGRMTGDPVEFKVKRRIVSHGVVEFDTGDRTLVRQYVHIDGYVGPTTGPHPWWHPLLLSVPFDVLLAKGAMAVFPSKWLDSEFNYGSTPFAKAWQQRGGIVVDADGVIWPWVKKTDSNVIRHDLGSSSIFFGYGRGGSLYVLKGGKP